jgi:amino acid transporter
MVLAFLLVFFGVQRYRDQLPERRISFGRAFTVGLLITVVASLCYVVTWEIIYFKLAPNFGDVYAEHMIEKARAQGATPQQLAVKTEQMTKFRELYRNPLINAAVTFIEPFPVGLLVTLVGAATLSRRRRSPAPSAAVAERAPVG